MSDREEEDEDLAQQSEDGEKDDDGADPVEENEGDDEAEAEADEDERPKTGASQRPQTAKSVQLIMRTNWHFATYRVVQNYSGLFENSRPSAARQLGQPVHSQSDNFGKFKLNSHNLAGIFLHHSITKMAKKLIAGCKNARK